MKKTDMELQAIREKLQRLESEAPHTGDVFNRPWSSPQQTQVSNAAQLVRPAQHQSNEDSSKTTASQTTLETPQAAAMAKLRERSVAQRAPSPHTTSPHTTSQRSITSDDGFNKADELVMQEIARLEIHARNINERSQQQSHEILAMKRSAQQAAVALRRQGIHQHPQLATIANFLEQYPSVRLPYLDRDTQGRFTLNHTTVDLNYAEQAALQTAQTLRNLTGNTTHLSSGAVSVQQATAHSAYSAHKTSEFSTLAPFSTSRATAEPETEESKKDSSEACSANSQHSLAQQSPDRRSHRSRKQGRSRWSIGLLNVFNRVHQHRQHLLKQPILAGSVTTAGNSANDFGETATVVYGTRHAQTTDQAIEQSAKSSRQTKARKISRRFSFLDAAIWFSAAAIVRIILEAVIISYPVTRMPLMLIVFTVISCSIYRVFISKSLDLTSTYRLGIVLIGLFLGSSF